MCAAAWRMMASAASSWRSARPVCIGGDEGPTEGLLVLSRGGELGRFRCARQGQAGGDARKVVRCQLGLAKCLQRRLEDGREGFFDAEADIRRPALCLAEPV